MLKEIYIDNFRRFTNQRIVFSECLLIRSKNGTGKTALIDLIQKLKNFIVNSDSTNHVSELFTLEDVPRWFSGDYGQVMTQMELKIQADANEYVYKFKTQLSLKDQKIRIYSEQLLMNVVFKYAYPQREEL
ncbi:MAG: ATP-binding protein [Treponema sp.]|jgi:predicted ATP-binding protein involved in virulence|nr:ATP-binding protein [Treponema sp.]